MSTAVQDTIAPVPAQAGGLERGIDWTGAFWVASGVPPLVLFSIGAVAATVGKLSWAIWTASIAMGFIQSFTYAEIAGLFPNKAGGTSIYGAIAWVRYGKLVAPISVWCNWFAWSPVQATGSALAAGYILSGLFAPDAAINTWQLTLLDLGYLKTGLSLRINAVFVLGAVILLGVKFIQDGGILRSANTTKILGISAMIPLLLIGIVPILTGDLVKANFFPLAPLAHDAVGRIADGTWNMAGITVFAAGMFLAAWSTYGFETAVCYTGEFKNPKTDTFKAIFYSGLLCVVVYTLVPFAFQGFLGLGTLVHPAVLDAAGNVATPAEYSGMLAPDIYSGMGVATVMARMVHAGQLVGAVVVIMLILAHAVSSVLGRLAAEVSRQGERPRRADERHAHQSWIQPAAVAAVGFGIRDRRREHRLSDLQFLEFERGLDSSAGPTAPGKAVARSDVDSRRRRGFVFREPRLHGIRCGCLRRRNTEDRADFRRAHRAGVRLPPLHPG
jgi:amino acid transporter